ncbi:SulP family inorganic anion transporter [Bacteriovoracaceae bacterium]|nr:SulP family inorganic anion transporter [Bacteriovoracaceae bacterium]
MNLNKYINRKDFLASIVVFFVALPLCMGISLASGVPPLYGLISGMIGGIIVGYFAGCPLQVSGPAAGLAVMVYNFVDSYGISALAPLGIIVGTTQILIYKFKLASYFKAVSPALIKGLLSGIGFIIFASQLHIALDLKPQGSGINNLITFPERAWMAISQNAYQSFLLCGLTIAVIVLWPKLFKKLSGIIPAPLAGIFTAAMVSYFAKLDISFINISSDLASSLNFISASSIAGITFGMVLSALAIAFVASAETLLSVAAVDRLSGQGFSSYNQEMKAQGIGNIIAGFFGVLPITGVIVRSSANIEMGAKSRGSAIIHGFWLLIMVLGLGSVLSYIPTSALAAILIITGVKLMNLPAIKGIFLKSKTEFMVFLITFLLIISVDLLAGVVSGFIVSVIFTIKNLKSFELTTEENGNKVDFIFKGTASFLHIPRIAKVLHNEGHMKKEVVLNIKNLTYKDWAIEEEISMWVDLRQKLGLTSDIIIEEPEGIINNNKKIRAA